MSQFSFGVITMSDSGAQGLRQDTSGEALKTLLIEHGYEYCFYKIVPDQVESIVEAVHRGVSDRRNARSNGPGI